MGTEDSVEVRKFMEEFGLTGDPAIDGENATDDLNALRLIEKEHKDGTFEKKLQEISAKLAGIG